MTPKPATVKGASPPSSKFVPRSPGSSSSGISTSEQSDFSPLSETELAYYREIKKLLGGKSHGIDREIQIDSAIKLLAADQFSIVRYKLLSPDEQFTSSEWVSMAKYIKGREDCHNVARWAVVGVDGADGRHALHKCAPFIVEAITASLASDDFKKQRYAVEACVGIIQQSLEQRAITAQAIWLLVNYCSRIKDGGKNIDSLLRPFNVKDSAPKNKEEITKEIAQYLLANAKQISDLPQVRESSNCDWFVLLDEPYLKFMSKDLATLVMQVYYNLLDTSNEETLNKLRDFDEIISKLKHSVEYVSFEGKEEKNIAITPVTPAETQDLLDKFILKILTLAKKAVGNIGERVYSGYIAFFISHIQYLSEQYLSQQPSDFLKQLDGFLKLSKNDEDKNTIVNAVVAALCEKFKERNLDKVFIKVFGRDNTDHKTYLDALIPKFDGIVEKITDYEEWLITFIKYGDIKIIEGWLSNLVSPIAYSVLKLKKLLSERDITLLDFLSNALKAECSNVGLVEKMDDMGTYRIKMDSIGLHKGKIEAIHNLLKTNPSAQVKNLVFRYIAEKLDYFVSIEENRSKGSQPMLLTSDFVRCLLENQTFLGILVNGGAEPQLMRSLVSLLDGRKDVLPYQKVIFLKDKIEQSLYDRLLGKLGYISPIIPIVAKEVPVAAIQPTGLEIQEKILGFIKTGQDEYYKSALMLVLDKYQYCTIDGFKQMYEKAQEDGQRSFLNALVTKKASSLKLVGKETTLISALFLDNNRHEFLCELMKAHRLFCEKVVNDAKFTRIAKALFLKNFPFLRELKLGSDELDNVKRNLIKAGVCSNFGFWRAWLFAKVCQVLFPHPKKAAVAAKCPAPVISSVNRSSSDGFVTSGLTRQDPNKENDLNEPAVEQTSNVLKVKDQAQTSKVAQSLPSIFRRTDGSNWSRFIDREITSGSVPIRGL